MVEKRIKGFANVIDAVGAAFVINRAAFFLDANDSQIHAVEVRESVLAAVDINGLAQGLLAWTKNLAETFFRNRFKEGSNVHNFGYWLLAISLWLTGTMPIAKGQKPKADYLYNFCQFLYSRSFHGALW